MIRVLSSATKAALGWICKHLMHWGVCNSLRPLYYSVLCFLKTRVSPILFSWHYFFTSFFISCVASRQRLSVVHCNLAQYWPRLWLMPCCSVPGTWTGTETPGDMSPEWKRERVGFQLSCFSASCQRLHTDIKSVDTLTGAGVGRGRLQMRGGVRRWVKAAWSRGGWR